MPAAPACLPLGLLALLASKPSKLLCYAFFHSFQPACHQMIAHSLHLDSLQAPDLSPCHQGTCGRKQHVKKRVCDILKDSLLLGIVLAEGVQHTLSHGRHSGLILCCLLLLSEDARKVTLVQVQDTTF